MTQDDLDKIAILYKRVGEQARKHNTPGLQDTGTPNLTPT